MADRLYITECPRDAMQGQAHFVPTERKIAYHKALLAAGFPTLDFGSFVSAKAIPQLADTAEVLAEIYPYKGDTELLAIVANERGAAEALATSKVDVLGFPLSVSETFQQRNTNKSIAEALTSLSAITKETLAGGRQMVAYLSMAFGNPYGESYGEQEVNGLTERLVDMGITRIMLSDTIGAATPAEVGAYYRLFSGKYPNVAWGCHLHTTPATADGVVAAAWQAGCRRMDTALGGYGGCPMASDSLTGNMPTEAVLGFAETHSIDTGINMDAIRQAQGLLVSLFV